MMNPIKEAVFRLRGQYTIDRLVKMGLTVGRNFAPQHGYELDPSHCWLITIGDDVVFGPNVSILAHDASTCGALGYAKIGCVTIGDRVFIGGGSVVLPGVTIGSDVIIGANSTVTKDVPDGCVYAGNPARFLISTEEYLDKHRRRMALSPCYGEAFTLRGNITAEKKKQMKDDLKTTGGYVV